VKLAHVTTGGAAHKAGLSAGDLLVAINGLRVSGNLDKLLSRHAPGERVQCHAFRRDELMTFTVTLDAAPADTCVLTLSGQADDKARARRDAWLDGPR
jgi:predicted metalloprotease with PDZ domain